MSSSEGGKSFHLLDIGLEGKTAAVFFCYVLLRLISETLNIRHHSELKFIYVFIYLLFDSFVFGEKSQYGEKWNSKWRAASGWLPKLGKHHLEHPTGAQERESECPHIYAFSQCTFVVHFLTVSNLR